MSDLTVDLAVASGLSPEESESEVQVISVGKSFQSPALLRPSSSEHFVDSGRENDEPFGSFDLDDQDGLLCNIGFIDDQMLMDVLQENNVIDTRLDEKVVLPQSVEVDLSSADKMEEDDIQVIFEGVKRPRTNQNKQAATHAKELKKLTVSNGRLTKQNESLIKELEDLKLEVAHQKSRNYLAQHKHSTQVLDVLNTELTCVICSDIIIEAVAIECGHIFCSHCISTWFSQQLLNSRSCPTCRTVTYRDPVKISNLNSTIASFHNILSQEVQSDRQQLLEDRKAEQRKVQEAATAARSRARTHRPIYLDLSGLTRARITRSVHHRLQRLSPDITGTHTSSPGQGQATSVQAQGIVPANIPLASQAQGGYNLGHRFISQPGVQVRPLTSISLSSLINNPIPTAPGLRFTPANLVATSTHSVTPTPSVAPANYQISPDQMSIAEAISARLRQRHPSPQVYDYRHSDPRLGPY